VLAPKELEGPGTLGFALIFPRESGAVREPATLDLGIARFELPNGASRPTIRARGVTRDGAVVDVFVRYSRSTGTRPGGPEPPALRVAANPARGPVDLRYSLAMRGRIDLVVFDALGREVRTLYSGEREPGDYEVEWDGRDRRDRRLPAGIYFVTLRTPSGTATRRVALLRAGG
jgi:hypothetical protein